MHTKGIAGTTRMVTNELTLFFVVILYLKRNLQTTYAV